MQKTGFLVHATYAGYCSACCGILSKFVQGNVFWPRRRLLFLTVEQLWRNLNDSSVPSAAPTACGLNYQIGSKVSPRILILTPPNRTCSHEKLSFFLVRTIPKVKTIKQAHCVKRITIPSPQLLTALETLCGRQRLRSRDGNGPVKWSQSGLLCRPRPVPAV